MVNKILIEEANAPKVLVADAYPLNMELTLEILKAQGFIAEGAEGGREAIAKAEKGIYDLVLTEIKLPGISGTEVVKLLKSKQVYKQVPVIALTACAMKGDRERFLAAGFDDYIPKPIDVHDFMERMGEFYKFTATCQKL